MARASSFWLQWGMLCSGFALVFAQDSSWDCTERDDILRDVPADVSTPSDCTLDCTARTYRTVLELQNRLTIRFRDSHPGEAEEYCWSTWIKCSPGQRLQSAFILLPVDLSVVNRETLRLQINSETNGATLHQHAEYSLFPIRMRPSLQRHGALSSKRAPGKPLCKNNISGAKHPGKRADVSAVPGHSLGEMRGSGINVTNPSRLLSVIAIRDITSDAQP